jgi:hypothetical protein
VPIKYSTHHIYGDARKAREVASELMLGVERVDGALREATMPVKSAHVSTPWTYLPKKQCRIVLFYKNLGQPIIPSLTIRLYSGYVIPFHREKISYYFWSFYSLFTSKKHSKQVPTLSDNVLWSFQYPVIEFH